MRHCASGNTSPVVLHISFSLQSTFEKVDTFEGGALIKEPWVTAGLSALQQCSSARLSEIPRKEAETGPIRYAELALPKFTMPLSFYNYLQSASLSYPNNSAEVLSTSPGNGSAEGFRRLIATLLKIAQEYFVHMPHDAI